MSKALSGMKSAVKVAQSKTVQPAAKPAAKKTAVKATPEKKAPVVKKTHEVKPTSTKQELAKLAKAALIKEVETPVAEVVETTILKTKAVEVTPTETVTQPLNSGFGYGSSPQMHSQNNTVTEKKSEPKKFTNFYSFGQLGTGFQPNN